MSTTSVSGPGAMTTIETTADHERVTAEIKTARDEGREPVWNGGQPVTKPEPAQTATIVSGGCSR